MNQARLSALLVELTRLPRETEWAEFKHNNCNHQEIGEYISALSNSAALAGKPAGYIVWGIEDSTHRIVGTTFNPKKEKVGNEALENWLMRLLFPRLEFQIHMFQHAGKEIVIIEVPMASNVPVRFQGEEFIRCGNHKKKLKDFPEKERALWALFSRHPFEKGIALEDVNAYDVIKLIDHQACLKQVSNDFLTNSSLRQRFAIGQKNYPMASRIISDTLAAGLIKKFEPEFKSRKDAKYLPFWA